VQARFPHSGSYEVSVDITDARGSTAMASVTVELGAAPPFEITFAPLFSNQLKREPLNILMRPRVTGGHPEDRITGYAYSVDDPKATVAPNNSSGVINGLTAGERTVRLEAASRMGQVVEADYQVSVAANQPPSCEITSWVSGVYTWYAAQCSDSDGRVVSRRWYLDDRLLSTGQSIRRGPNDPAGVLRFEAFDDGGAAYRTTLN